MTNFVTNLKFSHMREW